MMRNTACLGLLSLALLAACSRSADEFDDAPPAEELQQLRVDACEASCSTLDRCDPERFVGMDPPECYERCIHHMPLIDEENQCGSRELQWLLCLGDLSCEEFENWDVAVSLPNFHYDYACVAEYGRALACDYDEPFDMDEDNSHYP